MPRACPVEAPVSSYTKRSPRVSFVPRFARGGEAAAGETGYEAVNADFRSPDWDDTLSHFFRKTPRIFAFQCHSVFRSEAGLGEPFEFRASPARPSFFPMFSSILPHFALGTKESEVPYWTRFGWGIR